MSSATADYDIVTDANERSNRVGESAQQILGRSRAWMMWLPWIAMMGIGVFEYGYDAAAAKLQTHNHWSLSQAFWIVTVQPLVQPLVAFPAGRMRESGVFSVRTAMLAGAVLSAIGFLAIANTGSFLLVSQPQAVEDPKLS